MKKLNDPEEKIISVTLTLKLKHFNKLVKKKMTIKELSLRLQKIVEEL